MASYPLNVELVVRYDNRPPHVSVARCMLGEIGYFTTASGSTSIPAQPRLFICCQGVAEGEFLTAGRKKEGKKNAVRISAGLALGRRGPIIVTDCARSSGMTTDQQQQILHRPTDPRHDGRAIQQWRSQKFQLGKAFPSLLFSFQLSSLSSFFYIFRSFPCFPLFSSPFFL